MTFSMKLSFQHSFKYITRVINYSKIKTLRNSERKSNEIENKSFFEKNEWSKLMF